MWQMFSRGRPNYKVGYARIRSQRVNYNLLNCGLYNRGR